MFLHAIVQLGMLLAIVWKWEFFVWADKVYHAYTLNDSFFAAWLRSADVIRIAFLVACCAIAFNIFSWNRYLSLLCSYVTLAAISILCLHQGSYNDATFTTTWWTCVWATWYIHRMSDPNRELTLRRGAFLSRAIISMILLGGAVGKWTGEYWSGEVLYDIYFVERDYWVFNLLRDNFDQDTLRTIATWYSRKVVCVETICGFGIWMLPPKWAAAVAFIVLTSIVVFSNWYLFSVMFCLMGLALAGFFVVREDTGETGKTNEA